MIPTDHPSGSSQTERIGLPCTFIPHPSSSPRLTT
jgi:hypothetical protein